MPVEVYVDGTYSRKLKKARYGFIAYQDDEIVHVQKGEVKRFLNSWQITAELTGALRVFEWCLQQGILDFRLLFDYVGIEALVTGEYKPKSPVSHYYVRTYQSFHNQGIRPTFVKIDRKYNQAHSVANDNIFFGEGVIISDC